MTTYIFGIKMVPSKNSSDFAMGRCPKPKSVELSEGTISVAEIFQILCLKALQQVLYFLGAPATPLAAGEGDAASPGSSQDSSDACARFSAREKRIVSAIAKYKALAEHAQNLRLAAENEQKMKKNAQRLHDAKMKRLEAGDKRNRRKSGFRAACRTYEAVIELLEAQYKCENSMRIAAETETAAANAKICLLELM